MVRKHSGFRVAFWVLIVIVVVSLVGCSTVDSVVPMQTVDFDQSMVNGQIPVEESDLPEGVVRYCWEEPMVDYERVQPGVDDRGAFYLPAHTAVREVRMGRWRPCKEVHSKSFRSYGNDR